MIHVCNHRHVTDVGLLVHDGTDLVHCEVHLRSEGIKLILSLKVNINYWQHWQQAAVLNKVILYLQSLYN